MTKADPFSKSLDFCRRVGCTSILWGSPRQPRRGCGSLADLCPPSGQCGGQRWGSEVPLMVVCVCAFPGRELCSALRKLKAGLGDESPAGLSGSQSLPVWTQGVGFTLPRFQIVCDRADRSGSLDCQWERRRTHLGDAFHPSRCTCTGEVLPSLT